MWGAFQNELIFHSVKLVHHPFDFDTKVTAQVLVIHLIFLDVTR